MAGRQRAEGPEWGSDKGECGWKTGSWFRCIALHTITSSISGTRWKDLCARKRTSAMRFWFTMTRRPTIPLRSFGNMRRSIQILSNRFFRRKTSIQRVWKSYRRSFTRSPPGDILHFVKATTTGAMRTSCSGRWIFWRHTKKATRPVCTTQKCWIAETAKHTSKIAPGRIGTWRSGKL